MTQLQTYDLPDLVGIEKELRTNCELVSPGMPVHHKDDPKSYGMCVSRRWGPDNRSMQCEVLWSKQPEHANIHFPDITFERTMMCSIDDTLERELTLGYRTVKQVMSADPDIADVVHHYNPSIAQVHRIEIKRHSRGGR
jgi:hypothetical protein